MDLPVTTLYAGVSGILYLALSLGVIAVRRELQVPYGDNGQRMLIKRRTVRRSRITRHAAAI